MFGSFPKVHYLGGGGSSPAPQVQDNSLALQQDSEQYQTQQAALARQQALDDQNTAAAKTAADQQTAITQFQNDLKGANAGATNYANQQETSLGLTGGNDYGLMDNFNTQLANANSAIGSTQTGNASQFVNGQALFDAANTATLAAQRNNLTQQYNAMFSPNYQNTAIGDDLLNSNENDLLSGQQTSAQQAIDRAHARGTLDDTGYQYAIDQLGSQAAAAKSKIDAAGQTVLDKYRTGITDALGNATTSIANWNYNDPYSLSNTQNTVNSLVDTDKANAGNDFLSAVSGQQYFDPTTLLAQAGNYQGVTNPGVASTGTPASTAAGGNGALAGTSDATPFATKPVTSTKTSLGNQGIV